MLAAREALIRLQEGNRRFTATVNAPNDGTNSLCRPVLTATQDPIAVIFGCSDARVPAEIIFDQGLGDLFVIRVAGNVMAPSLVGSVEFAAAKFGTRLVVVMGHTECGAIAATLDEMRQPTVNQSKNLRAIVDRIRPSIEPLFHTELAKDPDALRARAVRANVRASANHLRHGSQMLEQLMLDDGLLVVGAEYSLDTGEVDFFDGVPQGD
jgi:carbonic anhydrase